MHIIKIACYFLFAIVCLLLGAIVLMQEPKGGGLGAAFGGAGGEAFGHGAGGVNKVTTSLGAAFFVLGIGIAWMETQPS